MFLVNIIAVVLALFLAYYLLYCIYIVYCASKYNLWKIKYKYPSVNYYQNLNVTVYSHNNGNDVVELLEQLKRQDYPQDKYKINIIQTVNLSDRMLLLSGMLIEFLQQTIQTDLFF